MKFSKLCIFILIIFTLFFSNFIIAEESLSLEQCISLSLKNNNLYKVFQQEYYASQARVRQAWAFPQPELSFDSDLQPKLFNYKKSDESYLGITQLIEIPGRRSLRGKIARKESEMVGCDLKLIRQDIIFNVKRSFYKLLLSIENQQYTEENLKMAQDFLNMAKEKYESGEVAKFEVLKAKVEAAKADNQFKVAINQTKLAKTQLNFFLAREKFQPIHVRGDLKTQPLELNLKSLKLLALNHRPELKKEQLSVKKESLAKKQAFLGYLPDVSLGISRHRIKNEPTTWDVALSFEVPLFFWQRISGEIAESKANLSAAKERLKYSELSIRLEVEKEYYNSVSLKNQINLFETEVLDEAETVYQMAMISYQEGKIGSIELIEARRSLIELKQAYAETLFNYQLALATLEKALGTSLQGIRHY